VRRAVLVFGLAFTACGGCGEDDKSPDPAAGPCTAAPIVASGEGTYYAATGAGNCSFDASPSDLMVAAINAVDYDHAALCGACLAVTGPAGEVVVRIVDQCPGCKQGDLDLSKEAFAKISPLSAGRVAITWHEVACEVQGPISYQFKDRSNAFWTAIQIRNHRYPIAKLEARDAANAWHPIVRADYNFFVADAGLGAGPYALRVVDTRGRTIEDEAIELGDAVTRTSAAQFPICP
jgi:expansin (peptidoglycan-binding protein)